MRKLLAATCVLALSTTAALAEFRYSGSKLQLYSANAAWAITLPREDWQIVNENAKPDGTAFYYFMVSRAKQIQVAVLFDRTKECATGPECRALWKTNSAEAFRAAVNPEESERNGFSIVQFHFEPPDKKPVVQANVSAHRVHDGYWIDVRVGKRTDTQPDQAAVLAVIDAIALAPKSLAGARQYPVAGIGKYLELDVPADWRDSVGTSRGVPAVELAPTSGSGFKVLLSSLPPNAADSPAPSRETMLAMAKDGVRAIQEKAVEKSIEPREIRGANAWGYRISATDRDPAPGEYRHLTQAFLVVGNVTCIATILSHDGQEKAAARALEVLLGARLN
jgi:hypothetical protein